MTPEQFKAARKKLGLSVSQMAQVLGTSVTHVRRMERSPEYGTHRNVTETVEKLVRAYLAGHRPKDWPV